MALVFTTLLSLLAAEALGSPLNIHNSQNPFLNPSSLGHTSAHNTTLHIPTGLPKSIDLYTALGDSYSAGTFSGPTVPNPKIPRCGRTTSSFAYRFNADFNPSSFHFNACGGDGTAQCRIGQIQRPEADYGSPDLVSMTIGGNDWFMFPSIAISCIFGPNEHDNFFVHWLWEAFCATSLGFARVTLWTMPGALEGLVKAAVETNREKGSERKVVVLGYAQLWNTKGDCPKGRDGQDWLGFPSEKQKEKMNSLVVDLNGLLKGAVEKVQNGAVFVDVDTQFEHHRLCDKEESYFLWDICDPNTNQLGVRQCVQKEGALHPSWGGHSVYLDALAKTAGLR